MNVQELYRPVGLYELELIRESDYAAFPPRLPHQPIFYPVMTIEYAEQIARVWNTIDEASGFMGAVTAFGVDAAYLDQFEEHVVGASKHRELWVPAEQVADFNAHIVGSIRVISVFYGERFDGERAW